MSEYRIAIFGNKYYSVAEKVKLAFVFYITAFSASLQFTVQYYIQSSPCLNALKVVKYKMSTAVLPKQVSPMRVPTELS